MSPGACASLVCDLRTATGSCWASPRRADSLADPSRIMTPRRAAVARSLVWLCVIGIPGGVLAYYASKAKYGSPPFGLGLVPFTVLFVLVFAAFLFTVVLLAIRIVRREHR